MAAEKYIIVSSCRIAGKHTPKGQILELDIEDKKDGELIALLNRNGRIAQATPKNVAAIQAELESERSAVPERAATRGARAVA